MNLKEVYFDLNQENGWNAKFQQIKNYVGAYSLNNKGSTIGRDIENRFRNKYREIVPFDDNRVILPTRDYDIDDNDYINASHIRFKDMHYIVTQCPVENTIEIFWIMVWNENISLIVMLNRNDGYEGDSYISSQLLSNDSNLELDDKQKSPSISVTIINTINYHGFCHKKLRIFNHRTGETREIDHINYYSWPEQGVPLCTESFMMSIELIRSLYHAQISDLQSQSKISPILVHCNAGAGRSGTFCLIHIALNIMEQEKSLNNINLLEICQELRTQRLGMVSTVKQLKYAFELVIEAFDRFENLQKTEPNTNNFLFCKEINEFYETKEHLSCEIKEIDDEDDGEEDDDDDDNFYIEDFDNIGTFSDESDKHVYSDDELIMHTQDSNELEPPDNSNTCNINCIQILLSSPASSISSNNSNIRQQLLEKRRRRNKLYLEQYNNDLTNNLLKRRRLLKTISESYSISLFSELNNNYPSAVIITATVIFLGAFIYTWFRNTEST